MSSWHWALVVLSVHDIVARGAISTDYVPSQNGTPYVLKKTKLKPISIFFGVMKTLLSFERVLLSPIIEWKRHGWSKVSKRRLFGRFGGPTAISEL